MPSGRIARLHVHKSHHACKRTETLFTPHSIYWHGSAKTRTRTNFIRARSLPGYPGHGKIAWVRVSILAVQCRQIEGSVNGA